MFSGKVITGDGIGKKLGFPTANLDITAKKTQLREGVYAGYAWLDHITYKAAISIKYSSDRVEVYILDYDGGDFYGKLLAAEAIQQIAQMEKFDSEDELKEKIKRDIQIVRDVLREEGGN